MRRDRSRTDHQWGDMFSSQMHDAILILYRTEYVVPVGVVKAAVCAEARHIRFGVRSAAYARSKGSIRNKPPSGVGYNRTYYSGIERGVQKYEPGKHREDANRVHAILTQ